MENVYAEIGAVAGSMLVSAVCGVAVVRYGLAGLTKRVERNESRFDELPKNYVPRTEVELALDGIKDIAKHTRDMLQAFIFGRTGHHASLGSIEAAAQNFVQICIHGLDGKQGLNLWEGRTSFLYLDNHKRDGIPDPLVTVGVGCAVMLTEALLLPFEIDGRPATEDEVAHDYAALQRAPFGLVATHYATYTKCRLPEAAIDALATRRFNTFIAALRRLFPAFDDFPETVKAGCLDLIYGLGVAGLIPPNYPSFRGAVLQRDWRRAAANCGADEHIHAYDARNEARRQLFLAAAPEQP